MFKNKKKLNTAILSSKNPVKVSKLRDKLATTEKDIKNHYDDWRDSVESKACANIQSNPGSFYKFIKKKSKIKGGIGPFMDEGGNPISNLKTMADLLRHQYSSVFSEPKMETLINDLPSFFASDINDSFLLDIHITKDDVNKAIGELKTSFGSGPDNIPAVLLKKCSSSLATPLVILFNHSIQSGTFPELLKLAIIIPIHKGDSKTAPANYRPVSLTSHIAKTLERIVRKVLVNYLEDKNYFNPNQHGFRSGRSCLTQLMNHYDNILDILEMGHNCDVIYLDFAKAFDKVDHHILFHKLKQAGIGGKLGIWLSSFLIGRLQQVKVGNILSDKAQVISGVPQGTVLGPILFLIMINDIDNNVEHSNVTLFADDTRVGRSISDEDDIVNLQVDLNKIYAWQDANNMKFNAGKFEAIKYGSNKNLKYDYCYLTPGAEDNIEETETVKDLGVLLDNDLNFTSHVNKVISKVNMKVGWIFRNFNTRNATILKPLWKSLIQPHIDYCSPLWFNSTNISALRCIENLQRRFTRRISGLAELNYWQRLKFLRVYSQERRLERYKIIYTWKALEHKIPSCGISGQISDRRGRTAKIKPLNNSSSSKIKSIRDGSFTVCGPRIFNSLPMHIRNLTECSIDTFKHHLDEFLAHIPDEPQCDYLKPRSINQQTGRFSNSIVDHLNNTSLVIVS